jgi:hypothetical protein
MLELNPRSAIDEDERLWIINLQDELRRNNKDLRPLSHFDLASHSVVCKNRPLKAVHRLRRLEKFKLQYNVPEHPTVYEAIKSVETFVHARPDFLQAISQDSLGRWVLSYQLQGLTDPSYHKAELTIEQEFTALYFLLLAMQPDLEAVRNGTIWIGDLQNITVQNLPISIVNGVRALCRNAFPIKVRDAPCWNAPSRFSAVYALCRPFFSAHLTEKLVWDCTPQVLQSFFSSQVLPRSLGGTQTRNEIMDILEANLTRRFENNKSFQLKGI